MSVRYGMAKWKRKLLKLPGRIQNKDETVQGNDHHRVDDRSGDSGDSGVSGDSRLHETIIGEVKQSI